MSAILPLSGDQQTSGARSKNDAHDPTRTLLMSCELVRWKQSHRGEFAMKRAVLICAVLAVLSPRYAEAAERVWRLGVLTLADGGAARSIMLPYLATRGFVEGRNLVV